NKVEMLARYNKAPFTSSNPAVIFGHTIGNIFPRVNDNSTIQHVIVLTSANPVNSKSSAKTFSRLITIQGNEKSFATLLTSWLVTEVFGHSLTAVDAVRDECL